LGYPLCSFLDLPDTLSWKTNSGRDLLSLFTGHEPGTPIGMRQLIMYLLGTLKNLRTV
jgi:hypothetical protein